MRHLVRLNAASVHAGDVGNVKHIDGMIRHLEVEGKTNNPQLVTPSIPQSLRNAGDFGGALAIATRDTRANVPAPTRSAKIRSS